MVWPSRDHVPRTKDDWKALVMREMETVLGIESVLARPIALSTRLGADLGLSSLTVVRLAGGLRRHFAGRPLPFQRLLVNRDGTILQDVRVSDLIDFLYDCDHVDIEKVP
jgi:acyl carrier protein